MEDTRVPVGSLRFQRMPIYVIEPEHVVRVYRTTPGLVHLQLRNPGWFATVGMTADQLRSTIQALQDGLAALEQPS